MDLVSRENLAQFEDSPEGAEPVGLQVTVIENYFTSMPTFREIANLSWQLQPTFRGGHQLGLQLVCHVAEFFPGAAVGRGSEGAARAG